MVTEDLSLFYILFKYLHQNPKNQKINNTNTLYHFLDTPLYGKAFLQVRETPPFYFLLK